MDQSSDCKVDIGIEVGISFYLFTYPACYSYGQRSCKSLQKNGFLYGPSESVAISIKSRRIHIKISFLVSLKRPVLEHGLYSLEVISVRAE